METKKIQSKLQKLLALSASPNEAEAALAMEKCKELMDKYDVRTIDINKETNEVDITTTSVPGYGARHATWESKLAAAIARCFDSEAVVQSSTNSWNIIFISGSSDGEVVVDLFKRLRRIISKSSKEYAKKNDGNARSVKRSFAYGMITTIYERLVELYVDKPETRALVVTKKEAIDAKMKSMFGKLRTSKSSKLRDRDAYMKGSEEGKGINLNRALKGKGVKSIGSDQ